MMAFSAEAIILWIVVCRVSDFGRAVNPNLSLKPFGVIFSHMQVWRKKRCDTYLVNFFARLILRPHSELKSLDPVGGCMVDK
jgi:hypothetical protein